MNMIERKEDLDNQTALSDRFGIQLGFENFSNSQYLQIMYQYYTNFDIKNDKGLINKKVFQCSLNKGSKLRREAYYLC